jgi:hypothetical protein
LRSCMWRGRDVARKRKPEPLAVMRVHPDPNNSRLYVHVRIWRTLKDFRAARPDLGRGARGAFTGHQRYSFKHGKQRKLPIFGTMELVRAWMGPTVAVHEFTHAAIAWAERVGLKGAEIVNPDWHPASAKTSVMPGDCPEERFCYALGNMYGQFNRRCCERGLYS